MKDLTKGRPSVLILTFALPIFLANLLQLTYSLADTRIVGTFLGDNALAAVGATGAFVDLLVGLFVGLCSGAGVGLAVLYRSNPSLKQNLFITGLTWAAGAFVGVAMQVIVAVFA